jgi:hypothetical protein
MQYQYIFFISANMCELPAIGLAASMLKWLMTIYTMRLLRSSVSGLCRFLNIFDTMFQIFDFVLTTFFEFSIVQLMPKEMEC